MQRLAFSGINTTLSLLWSPPYEDTFDCRDLILSAEVSLEADHKDGRSAKVTLPFTRMYVRKGNKYCTCASVIFVAGVPAKQSYPSERYSSTQQRDALRRHKHSRGVKLERVLINAKQV